MTAFVLLVPLALTSTKGWIRRLGTALAAAAPADLRQRDCRLPAFHLEGEGDHRRAGLLRGVPRAAARLPARLAAPVEPAAGAANLHAHNGLRLIPTLGSTAVWLLDICPFTPVICPLA